MSNKSETAATTLVIELLINSLEEAYIEKYSERPVVAFSQMKEIVKERFKGESKDWVEECLGDIREASLNQG